MKNWEGEQRHWGSTDTPVCASFTQARRIKRKDSNF